MWETDLQKLKSHVFIYKKQKKKKEHQVVKKIDCQWLLSALKTIFFSKTIYVFN